MTRAEFDHAAKEMIPVRLKDRSQCNYVNEWYMPFIDDDGTHCIDTHTGKTHLVDDSLLEALRTRERGATVNDIIDRLAAVDGGLRAVIPHGNGGFIDLTGIRTDEIAVEARSEGDGPGNRHVRRPMQPDTILWNSSPSSATARWSAKVTECGDDRVTRSSDQQALDTLKAPLPGKMRQP